LFKVTLIDIKPNEEFAIVMSLSHTIADGHTFYNIYSMLDCSASVRALNCVRQFKFGEQLSEACGKELLEWMRAPQFSQGLRKTLAESLPKVTGYTLNKDEIARIKAESKANGCDDFISTNDIVTSWFLNLCHNDFGMVVVNFRNRFEGITTDMAGNYHITILYDSNSYSTPEQIRKTLLTYNKGGILPTEEQTLQFNMGIVTNWSNFMKTIHVSSDNTSQPIAQYPLYAAADQGFKDTAFVFNVDSDTPAVLLMIRSPVDVDELVNKKDSSVNILSNKII